MSTILKTLRINFSGQSKSVVKPLLILKGILFLIGALGTLFTTFEFFDKSILASLLSLGCFIVLLILSIKYFERVFFHEFLIVDAKKIQIVLQSLFKKEVHEFLVDEIVFFDFAGNEPFTNNAMYNETFDITGLQASEKEVQYLIDRGTILIETKTVTFRFGKNLPSWDAEEAIQKVETFLNKSFNKIKHDINSEIEETL